MELGSKNDQNDEKMVVTENKERGLRLICPISFAEVSPGIFRSAYPSDKTLQFISTLKLKTSICLTPNDIQTNLRHFFQSNNIVLYEIDCGYNQEPFLSMSSDKVREAVEILEKSENWPCLVFCTNGKNRTSSIVGCYRKRSEIGLSFIFQEYNLFPGENYSADLSFIDRFR